jgi:outer membrane protein OmpA-like peptidoglycan-associated protein
MTLSERRAKAVEDYLVSRGVEARQLEAHGYGMSRPKTSDPLDGANRRVETRLAD